MNMSTNENNQETPELPEVIEAEILDPKEGPSDNIEVESTETPDPGQERKSVFFPILLGGIVAGGIGFGAHYFLPFLDRTEPPEAVDLTPLETENAAQSAAIEKLSAELSALPEMPNYSEEISAITARIDTKFEEFDGLRSELDLLQAELQELAARPMQSALPEEAIAAYEGALADLQTKLADERAAISQIAAEARAEITAAQEAATASEIAAIRLTQKASARASLGQIMSAIETGNRFSGALAELQENHDGEIPSVLFAVADEGVVSIDGLMDRFTPAARLSLQIARSTSANEEGGITAFLKTQLGIRSITPQEGNSPDAILSRAGAAVADNQIQNALAEIETLPQEAQAPFADWVNQAKTRQDAIDAAETLRDALRAN